MRRFRLPLLTLFLTVFLSLFLCDFLTGRQHIEYQDPYSRIKRITERKYGFASEDIMIPNAMCNYYYNGLKQKHADYNWKTAPNSYSVARFTGSRIENKAEIAPVMDLNPDEELTFLYALPSNKIRLAVIHSLYHERSETANDTAKKKNTLLSTAERERVASIMIWIQYGCQDASTSPARWWHENAATFGLTPDGDPLPVPASKLAQAKEK